MGGASSHVVAPPARAAAAQRWDHHCVRAEEAITDKANELGAQGWEMVGGAGGVDTQAFRTPLKLFWCFKRPAS